MVVRPLYLSMATALCVTGSVRTLSSDCTLRRTLDNVASPLHADVFLSINVRQTSTLKNVSNFVEIMRGLGHRIIHNDIYIDSGRYKETRSCADTLGRPQAEGMARCMRAVQSTNRKYDFVIRTRTDLYVPFRIMSLPKPISGTAYVGFVGKRCNGNTVWWTDDRFAILPTHAAQNAYLYGYGRDFCRRPCYDSSCRAPECKMGYSLMRRNVTPIDIRPISLDIGLQIIRSNCRLETLGKHWIRPSQLPPLIVNAVDFETITTAQLAKDYSGPPNSVLGVAPVGR